MPISSTRVLGSSMVIIETEACGWCGEDTSFGSGKFVNRIPANTDLSNTVWADYIEYRHYYNDPEQLPEVSCFLCEECELEDNDLEGEFYK